MIKDQSNVYGQPTQGMPPPYTDVYHRYPNQEMPQPYTGHPIQEMPQPYTGYPIQGMPQPYADQQYGYPYQCQPSLYATTTVIASGSAMTPRTQNEVDVIVVNDQDTETFAFSDKSIRRAFIRKVYGILMIQLSISLGFIAWFSYHEPTRKYVQKHLIMLYIALIVMIVCVIVMACCGNIRRKAPQNYIFLFVFTLVVSFVLGVVASTFEVEAVILAVGITAAVCLALTVFAFQTKWDFTVMGGALYVALIILILFGLISIFIHGRIMQLVYASLGALLFSLYLVYDTQLMIGGNHKYSISPEEYIFAALNLYLDVVNIFLFILAILGGSRN